MITLNKINKSFDGGVTFAVKDLSLNITEGETMVFLGSSGCGKTTTLKMINRLIEPTSGVIIVNGENVRDQEPVQLRRKIGYVFQGIGLFPHMTVQQNIEIVPRLLKWSSRKISQQSNKIFDLIGLPPNKFAKRFPNELSGGEQQRISVARALAGNQDYLLMDEPFGALDAITRDMLQKELLTLKERLKKTIIFVTHDILEAFTLGDRIAILHNGGLEQVGQKEEILNNPATPFVRATIKTFMNKWTSFSNIVNGN